MAKKSSGRQKLNVNEHDLIQYLIESSSADKKVSINDMAEHFTALIELAADKNIPDYHDLDADDLTDLSSYIEKLKDGKRSIVNDSVRVQVKRIISRFLNKRLAGNITIRCGISGTGTKRVKSTACEYYAETPFSEAEIMMIRDAISVFPFAEQKVTGKIVDSLNLFTPVSNRQEYRPNIVSVNKVHSTYYKNLNTIYKAFAEYYKSAADKKPGRKKSYNIKKLSFEYCRYNLKKELEVFPSSTGETVRVVNPVKTMWANGYYYLVTFTYDPEKNQIREKNYRIDRMKHVKCLDENADLPKNHFTGQKKKVYDIHTLLMQDDDRPMPSKDPEIIKAAMGMEPSGFSDSKHRRSSPIMYSGDHLPTVKIRCKAGVMNNAIDTFGFEFKVEDCKNGEFIMTLEDIAPLGVKMWALEYGEMCEILEPASLRESMARTVKGMNDKYSE